MAYSRATEIRVAVDAMESRDATRSGVLDDCARFALPRDQDLRYQTGDEGGEKPQPVSGEMVNGVDRFVGWLFSNTVGSLSDLFMLKDLDEARNDLPSVSSWYSKLTEVLIKSIQNSNFSLSSHEMMFSYAGFGQGFHSAEMDELTGRIINKAYSAAGRIWMTMDADGQPNGLYRKIEFTARQAVDKFGKENLPDDIVDAAGKENRAHDLFMFYYVVRKRAERKRELKTMQGRPWEGLWVAHSDKADSLVDEKGFISFPYQCPRFYAVDGEAHGRGVVHKAMYDVRALQRARNDYFETIESAIKPPLVTNDEDTSETFDYRAGSVNLVEDVSQIKEINTSSSIPAVKDLNEDLKGCVRSACYLDLVDIIDSQKVYQNPQTSELIERQISGILPVYSRLKSEFFEPYVSRILALMIERDSGLPPELRMIPQPPAQVLRPDGSFLYTVALTMRLDSKIQRLQNSNLLTFYGHAMSAAEAYAANPALDALIPKQKALRALAVNDNVDSDLINSESNEKKALAAQQQAAQQAQQQAMMQQMMKPVDMNQPVNADSPLEAMGGMMNG